MAEVNELKQAWDKVLEVDSQLNRARQRIKVLEEENALIKKTVRELVGQLARVVA